MFEETTVDVVDTEQSALDDVVQAVPQEEEAAPALSDALEQLMADGSEEAEDADDAQPDDNAEGAPKVDKGFKGRVNAAEAKGEKRGYERGMQEARAAWEAEKKAYEERLAKLQDLELMDDAKKLAAEEKITEKLAMRILRAERGLAPTADQPKKERDAQGRFMAKAPEPAQGEKSIPDVYVKSLLRQAERIQQRTGVDVNALFQSAPADVKQKIALGEMDFEDLVASQKGAPRTAPAIRTANNANKGIEARGIREMSDEQFDKLNAMIGSGKVFSAR